MADLPEEALDRGEQLIEFAEEFVEEISDELRNGSELLALAWTIAAVVIHKLKRPDTAEEVAAGAMLIINMVETLRGEHANAQH